MPIQDERYGTVPFDLFALQEWEYSLPHDTDDLQWQKVVHKYLALTPRQRFVGVQAYQYHNLSISVGYTQQPYHRASIFLASDVLVDDEGDTQNSEGPSTAALLSNLGAAKINRVLLVRQTQQERIISSLRCGAVCDRPLWVRTCYSPELNSRYEALAAAAEIGGHDGGGSVDAEMVLDDVGRYDAALVGSTEREVVESLMVKIPGFCDGLQGSVIEDYADDELEGGDGLEAASRRAAGLVYLLDREAIEEHIVKLLWLDVHGRCVWRNKARPEQLPGLAGAFRGGYSLEEAVDSHGLFDNLAE